MKYTQLLLSKSLSEQIRGVNSSNRAKLRPIKSFAICLVSGMAVLLLASCTKEASPSITEVAKNSDFIVLAFVDTNSGSAVYRFDHLISSRTGSSFSIASNTALPGSSLPIRPGYSYGEQALVFFTGDPAHGTLQHKLSLYFYHGRADNESLNEVIDRVKVAVSSVEHK